MNPYGRLIILFILLWGGVLLPAFGAEIQEQTVSMPVSETEEVITPWLEENGFEVFRALEETQHVILEAQRSQDHWIINLRPNSPLATKISVDTVNAPSSQQLDRLWAFLDSYVKMPNSDSDRYSPGIPETVRRQLASTVCLYAVRQGGSLQLSGFGIDASGIIVTTAHDLEIDQHIDVRFSDGKEVKGRVIKIDTYRDLCLVRVPGRIASTIPIRTGRYMPGRDDTLYSIGCPQHGMDEINSGFLDGPPRRVNGLPLWQVQMRVEHGSSGSPVLDSQGRLTAVVKGRYRGTNSVGFLIPFETLLHFLEKY